MKISRPLVLSAVSVLSLFAVGSPFPETHFYRTTYTQDFREVYNADWSELSPGPGAQIIDLDGAKETHRFRGLGGSFAECSGFLLSRMPEAKRAEVLEMLFGKSGLRLSLGRVHCAASDYSMHFYSYDDVDGDTELRHFTIDDDRRYVIPMIKAAMKVNPDLFLYSSPWSAPWWMKTNRAVSIGHLRDDMYDVYAEYIVKFLQAYAKEGIDIKAHTPQNEPCLPDIPARNTQNSPTMNCTAEEEAKLILVLRPHFDKAGIRTDIWMFDHNYHLSNHVDTVLATPGVRQSIAGIAWHSYNGDPDMIRKYRKGFPELENIHTEQGPVVNRQERDFLYWGERMLRGFNAGLTGYTNWLLLTDENGQPNTSCGHPCAGLIAVHSETGELIPSNQYQTFRHISPYVMPGASVLDAQPANSVPGVLAAKRIKETETSAFRNPDGSYVVVINHRDDVGAQIVIKLQGAYLPVVLLPKSLVTVVCKGLATVSVVNEADAYNAWPMIQSVGNRLICAYSRGSAHTIDEGARGVWARHSDDGGRTWSAPVKVVDDSAVGEVTTGKGVDSQGNMLLWVRSWSKDVRRHDLYRTKDGVAFEKIATPKLEPVPMQTTDILRIPDVGLMSLWFSAGYDYLKDSDGKAWGTLVSRDDGRTWERTTVERNLDGADWPTEPSAVYLGHGRILAVARSEGSRRYQFQMVSEDSGRTWRKFRTNIDDVHESTPSLVFDPQSRRLLNFYYERGARKLRCRTVNADGVFADPRAWPASTVLFKGHERRDYDAGNVNAVASGGQIFAATYTGTPSKSEVVVVRCL